MSWLTDIRDGFKGWRLYRRIRGRMGDMKGISWRSNRFRLGFGVLVTGILAMLAGDTKPMEWIAENWETVAVVAAGLFSVFSGAGTKRLEQQTKELSKQVAIQTSGTCSEIEAVAREIRLANGKGS